MSFGRVMRLWFPVLLWMLAIYIGSTDVLSNQHTSRWIGPILRWFNPGISDATIQGVQFFIRKCGHFSEYAVLAILVYRALAGALNLSLSRHWRIASSALALSAAYAATDELHQSFVSTRYGSVADVMIDSAGALVGLGVLCIWHQLRAPRSSVPRDAKMIPVESQELDKSACS